MMMMTIMITAQPCCSQLSRLRTHSFTFTRREQSQSQGQEGKRRLQEIMSDRGSGRRQELLESVGGGGGVVGEANRRRPLQLKAIRLGHTGGLQCEEGGVVGEANRRRPLQLKA